MQFNPKRSILSLALTAGLVFSLSACTAHKHKPAAQKSGQQGSTSPTPAPAKTAAQQLTEALTPKVTSEYRFDNHNQDDRVVEAKELKELSADDLKAIDARVQDLGERMGKLVLKSAKTAPEEIKNKIDALNGDQQAMALFALVRLNQAYGQAIAAKVQVVKQEPKKNEKGEVEKDAEGKEILVDVTEKKTETKKDENGNDVTVEVEVPVLVDGKDYQHSPSAALALALSKIGIVEAVPAPIAPEAPAAPAAEAPKAEEAPAAEAPKTEEAAPAAEAPKAEEAPAAGNPEAASPVIEVTPIEPIEAVEPPAVCPLCGNPGCIGFIQEEGKENEEACEENAEMSEEEILETLQQIEAQLPQGILKK